MYVIVIIVDSKYTKLLECGGHISSNFFYVIHTATSVHDERSRLVHLLHVADWPLLQNQGHLPDKIELAQVFIQLNCAAPCRLTNWAKFTGVHIIASS